MNGVARSAVVRVAWITALCVICVPSTLHAQVTKLPGLLRPDKLERWTPYTAEVVASPFQQGNTITAAHAINSSGELAGAGFQSLWHVGFYWPDASSVIDLSAAYGWGYSEAAGVDDFGVFVGGASVNPSTTKATAFFADLLNGPQFLPQLVADPNITSFAIDISNSGFIAGYSDSVPTQGLSGNPQRRAVLWTNAIIQDLGTLGGDVSVANAVNELGVVVGVSNLVPGELIRAFRWTAAAGMERLVGLEDGARTIAADVNDAGLIVGTADSGNGRFAVVWSNPTTFRVLPSLPGDMFSGGIAINNQGMIVGRGMTQSTIGARLWVGNQVVDLNDLIDEPTLELIGSTDINDAGQILVHAFDKSTDPWRAVSVVLTPR